MSPKLPPQATPRRVTQLWVTQLELGKRGGCRGARRYPKNCRQICENNLTPLWCFAPQALTSDTISTPRKAVPGPCRGASHSAPNLSDPPPFTSPRWEVLGDGYTNGCSSDWAHSRPALKCQRTNECPGVRAAHQALCNAECLPGLRCSVQGEQPEYRHPHQPATHTTWGSDQQTQHNFAPRLDKQSTAGNPIAPKSSLEHPSLAWMLFAAPGGTLKRPGQDRD